MLAEFSVYPVGAGESLSRYVARSIKLIEDSGLPYKACPMGTVVEGEWDEVFALIKKCRDAIAQDTGRVVLHINVDDRKGAKGRLAGKIESVEKKVGHRINK